jgi:hypothetical protein
MTREYGTGSGLAITQIALKGRGDYEHDHVGFPDQVEHLTGMSLRPKKGGWQKWGQRK